ncbi:hypothetical protein [Rhizobium azibense]|uniref:GSCFA family protein n=1 Tax=Rhizobium azibense TaxID=1136135 RepID=A0A4R3RRE4_9HYPH|nr:hypothetical protein [Rhizobium azibense]TCU34176.1 hypothetical protein EV129_113161 [Rhizobium azibense]
MIIGTFGSCLSRGIAERYVEAFGGKITTSVYHNRTDQFLDVFVKAVTPEPTLEVLMHLTNVTSQEDRAQLDEANILKNQVRSSMGKHLLVSGLPFLDAISSNSLDLLLMDNFIDSGAALKIGSVGGKTYRFFSRIKAADGNSLDIMPKLKPEVSAARTAELVQFIRSRSPRTEIVFSVFPWNTYPETSGRKEWAEAFQYHLQLEIPVIPPLHVPKSLQIEDTPSHFARDFYYVYSGMVHQIMSTKERRPRAGISSVRSKISPLPPIAQCGGAGRLPQ